MAYDLDDFINRLKTANIGFEKGIGEYKGDYYVPGGKYTPHLHLSKDGNFVGLKKKQDAMTTLVKNGKFNIETIQLEIDDLKKDSVTNVPGGAKDAMLELARQHKQNG